MTLTTKRAIRQVFLMERGFGTDSMRLTKVCPHCGKGNASANDTCADCGAALGETLFDLYRSRHTCCPGCGIAVTSAAVYCPACGTRIEQRKAAAV